MTDELRATAQRMVETEAADLVGNECAYPKLTEFLRDADDVGRAWLAANPTDDSEPASREWLLSLPRIDCDQILWHKSAFGGEWTKGRARRLLATLKG